MSSKETSWLVFSLVAMICAWSLACASAPQPPPQESKAATPEPQVEAQAPPSPISVPSLQAATEQAGTKDPVKLPPPNPGDIKDAVGRVFEKTATADTARPQQSFVVGDFNGDGSEDLAVVVQPSEGRLPEVNNELANWILEDPRKVFLPRPGLALPPPNKPVRVRAEKGDTLLAIIHGVGPQGWRNADARQTFLLKNGPASNMVTQPMKNLRQSKDRQKLPPIKGDAISAAIAGKSGLIVWTGAQYAWYSPDTK